MKFLDVGVALMIGISALTGVAIWTPRSGDATANRMAVQTHLRDQLLAFLETRGVPWLIHASLSEVCDSLSSSLNGSGNAFVSKGDESCGVPPPPGAVASNLTLQLLPFEMSLVSWSGG
jgi:hypothetical protein